MSDMEKAVEGGDEFIANQQKQYAEEQAAEAARAAEAAKNATYPREFNAHTQWVDDNVVPNVTYTGTQYSYDTKEEALARIDAARAAGKYVHYMDPPNASYVAELGATDWRVTIED